MTKAKSYAALAKEVRPKAKKLAETLAEAAAPRKTGARKLSAAANDKFKSPQELQKMLESAAVLIAIAKENDLNVGIVVPSGKLLPLNDRFFTEANKADDDSTDLMRALKVADNVMTKIKEARARGEDAAAIILKDRNIKKLPKDPVIGPVWGPAKTKK
jgi:hypothetical protein